MTIRQRGKYTNVTQGRFNDQILYFTSPSLLKDDKGLVFIRDCDGSPNIFFKHLETSLEKQLTFNDEGYLKSYIYYNGLKEKGLGKASICLDTHNNIVYYIHGTNICSVDLNGRSRIIAELPPDQVTAYTNVSKDGKRLCVPTTDAEALREVHSQDGHFYHVDRKVNEMNLHSHLNIYDTTTGNLLARETICTAWITHVQFSPINSNLILYNHEWASYDYGTRRMWVWDGGKHTALRKEKDERTRDDFVCHEVWDRDGKYIIYHGRYKNGICFLGRVSPDGASISEIAFPPEYGREGHFIPGKEGLIVSDGFYDKTSLLRRGVLKIRYFFQNYREPFCGRFICLLQVDWKEEEIQWIPFCRHGSKWDSQDCHPHPIFNHSCTAVYFNSNKTGVNSIYKMDIPSI